jgi:glycerophosphoryl diester phosphodiesterase
MKPRPALVWLSIAISIQASHLRSEETTWTFSNPADPFEPLEGSSVLDYHDPLLTGWGPLDTVFGSASSFGLPDIEGSDVSVMGFPACLPDQGYSVLHGFAPNGGLAPANLVANYTVVMDVLFPASSDGVWRSILQTDTSNTTDGDFFFQNQPSGGVGINGNYRGSIQPDTWHRVVWVVRAAPGEGQAHRYIDGRFVGAVGTTGSGLGERFALGPELLLFTDENNETAPGFLSSLTIIDRKLSYDEVVALGRPGAAGTAQPGPSAPPFTNLMARPVQTLGHRGASGCFPENTLMAVQMAFEQGAVGTEIDTRITSDGVVIAFHDGTLDRTTNGTGNVSDFTLAEIQQLDAGSWLDPQFAGERVPTLTEVLTDSRGKGIIYLDIKTGGQAQGFADALDASGFPVEDLWFWTPGNTSYAAEIRSLIPDARIVWGAPGDWRNDPDYFDDLKALGVIGFSFGQGGASLEFSHAAKAEGLFVEIFTILDPEQMRTGAERGVDFIETDFPEVMEAHQPARLAPASGPQPPSGATDLVGAQILSWVPGIDSTAHRIYFGTTDPPPFAVEQDFDLFKTPDLERDTTYYWRVDEVTASGIETGPVWSFTTRPAPTIDFVHEWHLNNGIESVSGDAILGFAGGPLTENSVSFEATDGVSVPHLPDGPGRYLRIPAFTDPAQGLDLSFTSTGPNGTGVYLNKYTVVTDIFVPGPQGWLPFFNTNPANTNDGDFFARAGGGLGIAALGYAADNTIQEGTWHRVIFAADLDAGNVTYYVDGQPVLKRTGGSLTDGRFSLLSSNDAAPHVRLFNDNNGETTEVLVSSIAFLDSTLDDKAAAELGAANAVGIFVTSPPSLDLWASLDQGQQNYVLNWNGREGVTYLVESSTDLQFWETVNANVVIDSNGQASALISSSNLTARPARFFRVRVEP